MNTLKMPVRAPLFSVLWIAMLAAGCGGGDASSPDAGAASSAPVVDAVEVADAASSPEVVAVAAEDDAMTTSYTVLPDELVVNNLFTDGLNGWTVGDAVLVNSALRPGQKALNVGWRALQKFEPGTSIQPGVSYTVKVRARNEKTTGSATVALKFQIPPYNEAFRTNKVVITGNTYKDYEFHFRAPVYTRAELSILASGTRTIIDTVSMKMRPAIPLTEPVPTPYAGTSTNPTGSFVPSGYSLAFNDEFNGTTLDRTKWHTRFIYNSGTSDRMHDEKQRYRDNDNHRVANGVLSLVARKVRDNDPNGINYESGMIRSDWTTKYGYFEARVKMPGGVGVWPAFWLNSDVSETGRLAWPPEIDIFEFVNNGVEDKVDMIHSNVVTNNRRNSEVFYADPAYNLQWTYWKAPYSFADDFHVVGAEWTPTTVTMYIDGKKIYTRASTWTYDDLTAGGPAHILLNLAIGGAWAGRHGIDDTAFPQALQIDWVRAYKKN